MIFTDNVERAINLSAVHHLPHTRIGLNTPYITHPYAVALIVSSYTRDEDVICAALMHDVIEDAVGYTFDHLEKDFNPRVVTIVRFVTEDKTGSDTIDKLRLNWDERKQKYLENLKKAPQESLIISAADSLHNLRSLLETHRQHGDTFWSSFGASLDKKMVLYGKIVAHMEHSLESPLAKDLRQTYEQACRMLLR
jgi:(p)ppGpp synthase/HD superfamily hydrolase